MAKRPPDLILRYSPISSPAPLGRGVLPPAFVRLEDAATGAVWDFNVATGEDAGGAVARLIARNLPEDGRPVIQLEDRPLFRKRKVTDLSDLVEFRWVPPIDVVSPEQALAALPKNKLARVPYGRTGAEMARATRKAIKGLRPGMRVQVVKGNEILHLMYSGRFGGKLRFAVISPEIRTYTLSAFETLVRDGNATIEA